MSKKPDFFRRYTSGLQALHDGLIRCAGYRRYFGNMAVARYFIEEICVSERAACIDSDAPTRCVPRNRDHGCTVMTLEVLAKAAQPRRPCLIRRYAKRKEAINAVSNIMACHSLGPPNVALDPARPPHDLEKASHNSTELTSRPLAPAQMNRCLLMIPVQSMKQTSHCLERKVRALISTLCGLSRGVDWRNSGPPRG